MLFEKDIVKLRLQVLLLGEKHKWWDSSFFTEESADFLEYVFPKTSYPTAFIAASEVGKEIHDKIVGTGKLHLFRLPQTLEEKTHRYVMDNEALSDLVKSTLQNEMGALEEMTELIAVHQEHGPVHIGSPTELKEDSNIIPVFAKHYFEAFKNNYQTYPYLK